MLAACAGGNRFVLLEDEDGGVGAIVVENRGGSRTLSELHAATEVGSAGTRSEEHTSELQSLMRISYAVFCLKKKKEQCNKSKPTKVLQKTTRHKCRLVY